MSSTQLMFERAARKFGLPSGSNNAQQNFVDAVNFALSELADLAYWDSREINTINDNMDLTTSNERILTKGISYYLTDMGYKPSTEEVNVYAKWQAAISTATMLTQQEQ